MENNKNKLDDFCDYYIANSQKKWKILQISLIYGLICFVLYLPTALFGLLYSHNQSTVWLAFLCIFAIAGFSVFICWFVIIFRIVMVKPKLTKPAIN